MNNPLRHVGQTARPEETVLTPDEQAGDAGAEARQQNQTDNAAGRVGGQPAPRDVPSRPPTGKKEIPDLEPGEPPPESSAGS